MIYIQKNFMLIIFNMICKFITISLLFMYIKKISSTNCELIPHLLSNHNHENKKVYMPISTKFMWLQKYAQSH